MTVSAWCVLRSTVSSRWHSCGRKREGEREDKAGEGEVNVGKEDRGKRD